MTSEVPKHVAIIMDGNGRWAQSRRMPRVEGHRQGVKRVRDIVEESRAQGVRYLTLYCFSSENWSRPEEEVSALMKLFLKHLTLEIEDLSKNGVRLRVIGDLSKLPGFVREAVRNAEGQTKDASDLELILAMSYGSRDEIVQGCKLLCQRVADNELQPEDVTHEMFSHSLYTHDIPDPELLIRTSGEMRISNFLLWQIAYTEIVISDLHWPDFSREEFQRCLQEYQHRDRRFGLTSEQVRAQQ